MQCEEARKQFADLLIDRLEEPALSEVAEHLSRCESCRSESDGLEALWARLGSIPAPQPGTELRERFDVMLDAYKDGLDSLPIRSRWHGANSWLTGWWPKQ